DRDSIETLHRHVQAFDPRIRGYRGNGSALDRICSALELHYWREQSPRSTAGYGMSHSAILVLLRRDGSVASRILFDENPSVLSQSIVAAVRNAGASRT
ncbi:MAG: SCO family protein, partial [Proteobacteria bacterium]|nr:SCO family protein [Pseudomonadota bacterium]